MGRKMDHKLVAGSQEYEVAHVVEKMKAEGITISHDEVKAIIKEFGHSRRRLYAIIRERQPKTETPTE